LFKHWLIIYAIIIGSPFAYYLMNKFLGGYVYRTELHLWMFAWPALVILFISLCIVSVQSIRTAQRNPVDAMRNE
jgi:putative ABC transport system permease protein